MSLVKNYTIDAKVCIQLTKEEDQLWLVFLPHFVLPTYSAQQIHELCARVDDDINKHFKNHITKVRYPE